MTDRKNRNLGQMLQDFGRIGDEEVTRALDYQREHGGYFGEALVALGFITAEELEFALAAQFDLPYVFPEVDTIDLDAARIVSPDWALARVALPISLSDNTLTLVVDSPHSTRAAEELERNTGFEVVLALASPDRIRQLIRDVFLRTDERPDDQELRPAIGMSDLLDRAMAEGATKVGVSLRGRVAVGWWEVRGTVHRRLLTAGWARSLDERVSPAPSRGDPGVVPEHEGALLWEGAELPVVIRILRTPAGQEILLRPGRDRPDDDPLLAPPPPSLVSDVRMLVRSGNGRFALSGTSSELVDRLLPGIPHLLLGPAVRTAHLVSGGTGAAGFTVTVPSAGPERTRFLGEFRAFRLDMVTAALDAPVAAWEPEVSRAAAASLVPLLTEGDRTALEQVGVPWEIRVHELEDGALEWELLSLAQSHDD